MKKILCLFGFHNDDQLNEKSEDGGTLSWFECKRCHRETDKICGHTFGPIAFKLKRNVHFKGLTSL